MKKIIGILFLLYSFISFAQEDKIQFNKLLTYSLVTENKGKGNESIKLWGNSNEEFLLSSAFSGVMDFKIFIDRQGLSPVSFGMNNTLNVENLWYTYLFYGYDNFTKKTNSNFKLSKLNNSDIISGIPCNHYMLEYGSDPDIEMPLKMGLCIDENNAINNVPLVNKLLNSKIFNQNTSITDLKIKGLVLKMYPFDTKEDYLILKSIKDTKDYVYFNQKAALDEIKNFNDSIKLETKKQLDSIDQFPDTIKIDKDSIDYAEDVENPSIESPYSDLPAYVSLYKNSAEGAANYAIDVMQHKDAWRVLPDHCKNIDSNLPNLKNKDFTSHLKNYVSQVCDMYLTQSCENHVDEKLTLDEIRHEALYMIENKQKLSSEDQKKVDKYLKNLD